MDKLKIFSVNWAAKTAGPSLDGTRTELFLMGCRKAEEGDPCKGCFNPDLWKDRATITYEPAEAAEQIERFSPNKFITIVGGEPLDQPEPLAELCTLLKAKGFHTLVFTHYTLDYLLYSGEFPRIQDLINNVDILIDGEYEEASRIYNVDAGCIIGSGNQTIWDLHYGRETIEGVKAGDVYQMAVDKDFNLHLLMVDKHYKVHYIINQKGAGTAWPAA